MGETLNLLYHVFIGFPLCVLFIAGGLLFCLTIIGIPFGLTMIAAGVKML